MKPSSPAQPKEPQPLQPGAAHRRLDVFVGNWRSSGETFAEGQRADDPRASSLPWTSEESYEWLPGGFFLLHRWDAMAGSLEFKGSEVIGHDAEGGYFTRFFDNAGNHPDYRLAVDGQVWTFSEPATRATVTVVEGGKRMNFNWEWRQGEGRWLPLCERVAQRVEA